MKTQIRTGLFETNSSSIHCITIGNNGSNPEKFPDKLVFEEGDFGWEHEVYNDTHTKASYLYTALIYMEDKREEYKERIKEILKKWNIEVEFVPYVKHSWGYRHYIDHGYCIKEFVIDLVNNEEYLMNYLFSNESYVETGNDNVDIEWGKYAPNPKNVLYEFKKGN